MHSGNCPTVTGDANVFYKSLFTRFNQCPECTTLFKYLYTIIGINQGMHLDKINTIGSQTIQRAV